MMDDAPAAVWQWSTPENENTDLIGIGLYDDGSGWMTFYDGYRMENTDFALTPAQVRCIRDGLRGE